MSQNLEQEWISAKNRRTESPSGHPLVIEPYRAEYQESVISHILGIQRDEFLIPVTIDDQPDLLSIEGVYQAGRGNFFVARRRDEVIGTIGLIDIGNRRGALRKMFVKPGYRGKPFNAGQLLWQRLLEWSRSQGLAEIYLGTHPFFHAAHRFYEKNGFQEIGRDKLPAGFQAMKVDTRFYRYII
ncbi:MAG: GNAT family N-acetyltransferase [Firmicutes bacterium]|nr:GNAT family N-acetyltransferase [Bacillota bacterium]